MDKKSGLLVFLIFIFSGLFFVIGYGVGYVPVEESSDGGYITEDGKVDTTNNKLELPVGYYVYDSNKVGSNYIGVNFNSDGTADILNGMYNGSGYVGKGIYSVGKNKLYIYNSACEMVNIDDECVFPNCTNIYELDYVDGNIKYNNNVLKQVSETEYNEFKDKDKVIG